MAEKETRYYIVKGHKSWTPKQIETAIKRWKKCRACGCKVRKKYLGTKYYYIILSRTCNWDHLHFCKSHCNMRKRSGIDWIDYDYCLGKPKQIWTKREIERHAQKKAAKLAEKEAAKNLSVVGRLFTSTQEPEKWYVDGEINIYLFTSEQGKKCSGIRYRKTLGANQVSMTPVRMWKRVVYNALRDDVWQENDLTFLVKYGAPADIITEGAKPWTEALKALGRI